MPLPPSTRSEHCSAERYDTNPAGATKGGVRWHWHRDSDFVGRGHEVGTGAGHADETLHEHPHRSASLRANVSITFPVAWNRSVFRLGKTPTDHHHVRQPCRAAPRRVRGGEQLVRSTGRLIPATSSDETSTRGALPKGRPREPALRRAGDLTLVALDGQSSIGPQNDGDGREILRHGGHQNRRSERLKQTSSQFRGSLLTESRLQAGSPSTRLIASAGTEETQVRALATLVFR